MHANSAITIPHIFVEGVWHNVAGWPVH